MNRHYHYTEIDSTNNALHRMGPDEAPDLTLATADYQSAGKGRRGRNFMQEPGQSIAMSILLRPGQTLPIDRAPGLTPVMALAGRRALCEITEDNDVRLKWPNDVLVHMKKICGILTEMYPAENGGIDHIIIGVGVNVNQKSFPEDLPYAGSLFTVFGREYDRERIIRGICREFESLYGQFLKTRDLSLMLGEYRDSLLNMDREVRILDPAGEYIATAVDVLADGSLVVETGDGNRHSVDSGEVSVRGVYGYC